MIAIGCSDEPGGSGAGPAAPDGGGSDSSAWPDGSVPPEDGSLPTPDAMPSPEAYDPCASGECWTAPTIGGACGTRTIAEDFASGLYAVHRYLLLAPPGVDVELETTATAGSWEPMLIVHDAQGNTVWDGETSLSSAALAVQAGAGSVRVNAPAGMHLAVYLTDRAVAEGGFQSAVPQDAEYSLEVAASCTAPPALTVRGVTLGARQEMWVRLIGTEVVPELVGTASERIDKAAYVTWWSLKEGVLDVNNPLSYSNCSIPPDQHIGPVEICPDPGNAWQVGLSAVQAAYKTLANVETLAQSVHPEKSITEILTGAASAAGFGAKTELGQTIASSSDRLRLSWLLRDSAVGFEAQYPIVHSECFTGAEKPWCFGTGWASSAAYAPTRAGADQAVADLKSIFAALAP